jgi:uncharacterized protein YhaN
VTELQRDLDSDLRLVQLREELKISKELTIKHDIELKAIEEESKVYKERCQVLEMVAEAREGDKEQSKFVTREKKRLEQEVEKLKAAIQEKEGSMQDLVKALQTAREKIVSEDHSFFDCEED